MPCRLPGVGLSGHGRGYQLGAVVALVLIVAGFGGNSYLARVYTPEGAVRQYLAALQSGDSSSAWSAIHVASSGSATVSLTDRAALGAALSSARPDIRSFAITSTTTTQSDAAQVVVSYETSSGTKDATFLVKRSGQNALLFYPGWQVVVAPVVTQVSQPTGSGDVLIDGKSVDLAGGKATVALLPMAHQIRFAGTAMVQPQTIKVDLFSVGAQTVAYKPTLTAVGVDKATAAIKAAFAACAAQAAPRPEGCPQSMPNSGLPTGQWQLVGDPVQGLAFAVDSTPNVVGQGHFQMVFSYTRSGVDGGTHVPTGGGYQSILILSPEGISVGSIQSASGLSGVPRPTAATDQAVEAIVAPALKACATVISASPGACPQLFAFPDSSDYHWTLLTDPLLDARVTYDADSGLFTVKGDFKMKLDYKLKGYAYTTYSNNTTYLAYLFWDGQKLVLVTIDGQ